MKKIAVTQDDLVKILNHQNEKVFALIETRDKNEPDSESYKNLQLELEKENQVSMLLIYLINYTEGLIKLENILK